MLRELLSFSLHLKFNFNSNSFTEFFVMHQISFCTTVWLCYYVVYYELLRKVCLFLYLFIDISKNTSDYTRTSNLKVCNRYYKQMCS